MTKVLRFFEATTAASGEIQEFCDPCSVRFCQWFPGEIMHELDHSETRVCDCCGAWRDGVGAGQRVFA